MATTYGSLRFSKKSIDGNASDSLRVSTSTTAPIAPTARSSHMNQNRCWPGVPNTYNTRSESSETRPKSIATVVVDLFGVPERSSTDTLASVIDASVVRGLISDTPPTSVVLPTPKPPATTIFADEVGPAAADVFASELNSPKATEHPFHELDTRPVPHTGARRMHQNQPQPGNVAHKHSNHTQRQLQQSRDLGNRPGIQTQVTDRTVLGNTHPIEHPAAFTGRDQRLDGQIVTRFGTSPGAKVRSYQTRSRLRAGVDRLFSLTPRYGSDRRHTSGTTTRPVIRPEGHREEPAVASRLRGIRATHTVQLRDRAGEETVVDTTEIVVSRIADGLVPSLVRSLYALILRHGPYVGTPLWLPRGRSWRPATSTHGLVTVRTTAAGAPPAA